MSGAAIGLLMFGGMLLLMALRIPIAAAMFIPGALGYWALTNDAALLNHLIHLGVGQLDQLLDRLVRKLLLQVLKHLRRVRNWRYVWLGVKLGILVRRIDVRKVASDWLGVHVTLALLKHGSRLRLILAVLGHNLLQLLVLVMNVLNLIALRRNQQPLVHVDDVNVNQCILLLKTLCVACRLVTGSKAPANLHAKLLILLRLVRTDERNASKQLARDSQIILLERPHYYYTCTKYL
jgi:hypothetical protein